MADPNLLMGLKQQIDELATQAGLIEPPQTQPAGQPSPAMPTQGGQGGQGGIDLQGLIQQAVPFLQQLVTLLTSVNMLVTISQLSHCLTAYIS